MCWNNGILRRTSNHAASVDSRLSATIGEPRNYGVFDLSRWHRPRRVNANASLANHTLQPRIKQHQAMMSELKCDWALACCHEE